MSRTLASSSGSVQNLNVSVRYGLMSKCFQIRAMLACEITTPLRRSRSASSRDDQWVMPSSVGGSVNVMVNTSSRTSWEIEGGLPDRGASPSPT